MNSEQVIPPKRLPRPPARHSSSDDTSNTTEDNSPPVSSVFSSQHGSGGTSSHSPGRTALPPLPTGPPPRRPHPTTPPPIKPPPLPSFANVRSPGQRSYTESASDRMLLRTQSETALPKVTAGFTSARPTNAGGVGSPQLKPRPRPTLGSFRGSPDSPREDGEMPNRSPRSLNAAEAASPPSTELPPTLLPNFFRPKRVLGSSHEAPEASTSPKPDKNIFASLRGMPKGGVMVAPLFSRPPEFISKPPATEEPPPPPEEPPAPKDKRTLIAEEIVKTEQSFVQSMTILVKVYMPALNALTANPEANLKRDDFKKLFSTVEQILPLNKALLADLEARMQNWGPNSLIADIFLGFAPYLKMYTEYSNNYDSANKLYLELIEKNFLFYETVNACVNSPDNVQKQSLENLLIMPVQRIPRYSLLLADLLKNTDPSHPDAPNLTKALEKMKEVTEHINRSVQQAENIRKLMQASSKGAGFRGLLEAHRKLLHDGVVSISYGMAKKPTDKLHFFLFNDIFVYAKPSDVKKQMDMSKIDTKFPLQLVWVKDHPETMFEVLAPMQCFIVHCMTVEEKVKWITELRNAISNVLAGTDSTEENRFGSYEVHEDGIYEGWWKDGRPHGQGTFSFCGNEYTGEWKEGLKCGKGTFTFATGVVYNGDFDHDLMNGHGTLTYPNGDYYTGEWRDGCKHGKGEFHYMDGSSYVGDWVDDQPSGWGKLVWRNGVVYEGSWLEGKFHGHGTLTNSRGEMYRGEFVAGKREGKGVFSSPTMCYDGMWKEDKFHGMGTLTDDAEKTIYVGNWEHGEKEGQGTITYGDGARYEGQWKQGKRHGKGTMHLANGDRFVGLFRTGKFHGKGVYTYKNGTKLEGSWEKGSREGDFVLLLPGMKKLVGVAHDSVVTCKLSKEKVDFRLSADPPDFDVNF